MIWWILLVGCFNLQGDRIHCCPRSHSLSVPHTCRHWEQSQGRTRNPPHTRPRNQKARLHQGTSLGMSSCTKCRSCSVGRARLHIATEVKQGMEWREGERDKRRGKTCVMCCDCGCSQVHHCCAVVLTSIKGEISSAPLHEDVFYPNKRNGTPSLSNIKYFFHKSPPTYDRILKTSTDRL